VGAAAAVAAAAVAAAAVAAAAECASWWRLARLLTYFLARSSHD